jgi:hypothetical protein
MGAGVMRDRVVPIVVIGVVLGGLAFAAIVEVVARWR